MGDASKTVVLTVEGTRIRVPSVLLFVGCTYSVQSAIRWTIKD